jgi:hypothetical protein
VKLCTRLALLCNNAVATPKVPFFLLSSDYSFVLDYIEGARDFRTKLLIVDLENYFLGINHHIHRTAEQA